MLAQAPCFTNVIDDTSVRLDGAYLEGHNVSIESRQTHPPIQRRRRWTTVRMARRGLHHPDQRAPNDDQHRNGNRLDPAKSDNRQSCPKAHLPRQTPLPKLRTPHRPRPSHSRCHRHPPRPNRHSLPRTSQKPVITCQPQQIRQTQIKMIK